MCRDHYERTSTYIMQSTRHIYSSIVIKFEQRMTFAGHASKSDCEACTQAVIKAEDLENYSSGLRAVKGDIIFIIR